MTDASGSDIWIQWQDGSGARVERQSIWIPRSRHRSGVKSHTFTSRGKCRSARELRDAVRLQMRAEVGFLSATPFDRLPTEAARNHPKSLWWSPGLPAACKVSSGRTGGVHSISANAGVRLPSFRKPCH